MPHSRDSRPASNRHRVFEAEHPHLVRFTPTTRIIWNAIRNDLSAHHFTFEDLAELFGSHFDSSHDATSIDRARLTRAVSALSAASLIERDEQKGWRLTPEGYEYDMAPHEGAGDEEGFSRKF
jgi:hypothetical protein